MIGEFEFFTNNEFTNTELTNILISLSDSTETGPTELAIHKRTFTEKQFVKLCDVLSKNTRVRKLSLSGCVIVNSSPLTDYIMGYNLHKVLNTNQCLQQLELQSCCLSDYDVVFIADALANNRGLQQLDLSNNIFSLLGIASICTNLVTNQCLQLLDLRGNPCYSEDEDKIVNALNLMLDQNRHLERLDFDYTDEPSQRVKIEKKLERNTFESKMQKRLAFCMGALSGPKNKSPVRVLTTDPLFDPGLIQLIFSFSKLASQNTVMPDKEEEVKIADESQQSGEVQTKSSTGLSSIMSLVSTNTKSIYRYFFGDTNKHGTSKGCSSLHPKK